jgi:hypothetical protein
VQVAGISLPLYMPKYPFRPTTLKDPTNINDFKYQTPSHKGKVFPVLNLIKHYAMKAYGGVDV